MSEKFIILCSRLHLSQQAVSEIERSLESRLDWDRVVEKADREGVAQLLYRHLKKFPDKIPESTLKKLQKIYQVNTAHNLYSYEKLRPLLQEIRDAKLRVALTKGARLAPTLYGDIGLRPFTDIDMIVHPEDWEKLISLFRRLRFVQNEYGEDVSKQRAKSYDWTYYAYFQREGLLADIHCYPFDVRMPARNIDEFWKSMQRETISETEVFVLPLESEFCKLCVHTQKHSYFPLIWMTDIAELASGGNLDWHKVGRVAGEEEIRAPVSYGLYLVNRLWPGTVSTGVLDLFEVSPFNQKLLRFFWPEERIVSRELLGRAPLEKVPEHTPTLFSLFSGKRFLTKVKTVFQVLFPRQAWVAHAHHIPPHSLKIYFHYLLRLYKIVRVSLKFFLARK